VKVGILIPTFNRLAYLKDALRSALEQTHRVLSVVVIDNGSEDATSEHMWEVSDPRVSYVRNDSNLGLIGSINKGIRLMPEEAAWCTVLSDDDMLDSRYVEKSLEEAERFGARAIVDSRRVFIDSEGKKTRNAAPAPAEESAFDYLRNRMKGLRETYLTGVLFNRCAFEEIGGYPEFATGMASDDAFIFALSLKDRLVSAKSMPGFGDGLCAMLAAQSSFSLTSRTASRSTCRASRSRIGTPYSWAAAIATSRALARFWLTR